MPETEKKDAKNKAVKVKMANLELENLQLKAALDASMKETADLKRQLNESNTVLERDLSADLEMKIKAMTDNQVTDADLEAMSIEQKQDMVKVLSLARKPEAPNPFLSIKAGAAGKVDRSQRLTVGCLYKKTADEIKKMGGS